MKRLICVLLTFIILFGAVACSPAGDIEDTTDTEAATDLPETTEEPEETEAPLVIKEDTLVFVQNNISEYTIIRPENPTDANMKAASELRSYIEKISGVGIPIKTDAEAAGEYEILVGYTNRSAEGQFDAAKLGNEGFVIETVGKKLFIAGSGVRGALYGVYTFLEDYLGCRFYTSDYEKIPSRDVLGVQPIERDEQIPVFEYRDIDFVTSRQNNFQAKLKANGVYNNTPAEFGGKIEYIGGFVHTLEKWISVEEYFADHPEYFALNEDGTRQSGWGAQPCLSNPDVLRLVKEKVRSLLKDRPDAKIISISQPDNGTAQKPCMCPECKKIYAEEGAYSGAQIRFVNAVAEEFAKDYHDLKFDTLAYHHTRSICKTPPADNVIVRFCTIECCFSHPLGTCKDVYAMAGSEKTISEDISDWAKVSDKLYVWDYTTNFVESVTFFPNFNVLRENAKFFADNHVIGVYEEANFFSDTCDFSELRSYIMAKLLWNPYMSEEEYWNYIDEFLKDYYGNGWKYIREYIDLAQKFVEDKHFGIHDKFAYTIFAPTVDRTNKELPADLTLDMIKNYEGVDWSKYLDYGAKVTECEIVTRGFELFDAAAALAGPEQAERIAKLRLIPEFAHSYALAEVYSSTAIKDNIVALLYDFFQKDAQGKAVPMGERTALTLAVRNHVVEQYGNIYEDYNRDLCERALSYGLYQIYEGMPQVLSIDDPKLNLKTTPDKWRPRD
ncbi:MAG: DUF4838 domain-containing protein [Clostridia bacterium]|nr:DUF4838 domain-containing protein [Clostridia bacterium]